MMVGIVVSNSILIVEFTNRLRAEGRPLREAVSLACRVRLRPVLMTSLATLFGLLPMAPSWARAARLTRPWPGRSSAACRFRGADGVHRPGRVLRPVPPAGRAGEDPGRRGRAHTDAMTPCQDIKRLFLIFTSGVLAMVRPLAAETNALPDLALAEARALALRNHPQVAAANYRTLAAEQVVKETRSGLFPAAALYGTAAGTAPHDTRVLAGDLSSPHVYDKAAGGLGLSSSSRISAAHSTSLPARATRPRRSAKMPSSPVNKFFWEWTPATLGCWKPRRYWMSHTRRWIHGNCFSTRSACGVQQTQIRAGCQFCAGRSGRRAFAGAEGSERRRHCYGFTVHRARLSRIPSLPACRTVAPAGRGHQ